MLEDIKTLVQAGRWADLRALDEAALADLTGDDRARAYLYIATAYFNTATCGDDWRTALRRAKLGLADARPGGLVHTWALQKVACLVVDMGPAAPVKRYALAYLKAAPAHPEVRPFTPYVTRALSQVAYRERRYLLAARLRRQTLAQFRALGNEAEVARSAIALAWAYARAKRTALARSVLPEAVPDRITYLRSGAAAVIYAAEGRWNDASSAGLAALQGARLAHDFADAAEVSLILAEAARRLGAAADVLTFIREAATLAARQAQNAYALLVLTLRAKGGDFFETAASRSSGGFHPECGLTTGVG